MSHPIKEIRGPLIAIIVGMFRVLLNMTAMNVAIPSLVDSFHSSISVVQWSTTGYILAEAIIIPVAGWLSFHLGQATLEGAATGAECLPFLCLHKRNPSCMDYSDSVLRLIVFEPCVPSESSGLQCF
jgi:hypothetical protein